MAEIKIEKKKKPVWPWILALVIIGGILIWIWTDDAEPVTDEPGVVAEEQIDQARERENRTARENSDNSAPDDGAVNEYVQYVEENAESMGLEHEYTHKGLTNLAEALESVASQMPGSPNVQSDISNLKQQADRLMKETESTKHANTIREAFMSSANVLEEFQQNQYPDMQQEVQELKSIAKNIDKSKMATEQSDAVNRFFAQSADVVSRMSDNIES